MTSADSIARLRQHSLQEMWLFTGRHAVVARIVAWIRAEVAGAFVVTGSAGSGKSAVVRRIVALSAPAQRRMVLEHAPLEPVDPDLDVGAVDASVHLRGMGAQDLATVLAESLQLPAPGSCWHLVEAVAALPSPPVLVFDGLDEAIPEQATEIVTDLLVPLSVVARVLLATRYGEFGWQPPLSGQKAGLGELFGANTSVVDLDAEPDTRQDIERYLTRRLRSAGRADLLAQVAPVLARKAATQPGGFLYASTVVSQIVRGVIDARAPGWEGQLAATTAEALEQDLASGTLVREGVELADAARDLLRALAWGTGRGLPRQGVWEAVATALSPNGVRYGPADLDWVLQRYGCYIIADEQDGEAVYRLSHRVFVGHLLACSPNVAGRAAGQALAEALVTLAQQQTRHGEVCSPYLRRHLPRHAAQAGPLGVAALRQLAETDPERYLPSLAAALCDFTTHLLTVGSREAALISTQHAIDTYRALVDANPERYLPGLAAALGSLAAQHGELKAHDVALVPAQEATEICRALTETSAEVYFPYLTMALKNLTYHLAALGWVSAAVDVYTSYIEAFAASPVPRDSLIIERAGFHINHGDASTGLRELVTLLTLDDGRTPDAVMISARHVLRAHRSRDCAAVKAVWQEVTGTEPPDWLALTLAQIGLVTTWVTAPSWAKSKEIFTAHAGELLEAPAALVLDELALVAPEQVELHRHLLTGVRELGLEAAYRPLLLKDLLTDWIKLPDWQKSRSFAEQHATDLLTAEAEIALHHLGNPIGTLVHVALLRFAQREGFSAAYAYVTDRQVAANRMRRALAEADLDFIAQFAALEGQVFGERFTAAAHLAIAASLLGEVVIDPTRLRELAEQAAPADRRRVAIEIADLISRVPDRAPLLCTLPRILSSPNVRSSDQSETAPKGRPESGD